MKKKAIGSLLLGLCLGLLVQTAQAAGVTRYEKFIDPEFWAQKNPKGEEIILDAKGIKNYNAKIVEASRSVVDLKAFPTSYSGDSLKTRIMDYQVLEDDLYLRGNKVSDNYKNILRQQTNVQAIPKTIKPQYALTVRRSSLRNLPTGEALFYDAGDRDFDVLQETALDPGEPVLVLHTSANGYFHYVQARNYSGWISKFNIALTDKATWTKYLEPKSFLVVTDKNLALKIGNEIVDYQQGSILPIVATAEKAYTLMAPGRANNGKYTKMGPMVVKSNPAVHVGYLPYTSNNIIRSAFKFYDMPYGWGGLKNSVDCSSLMYNAYRTVGIYLPRNADQQEETSGYKVSLEGMRIGERVKAVNKMQPGAGLYMDGHVVMYLGSSNNGPYAIHAIGSYVSKDGVERPMKVLVSDLSLLRGDGRTQLEHLTNLVEFK